MIMSTPKQRQNIGYLRRLIGLDDNLYYEMLQEKYKVESSIALTINQAEDFLYSLRQKALQIGLIKPRSGFFRTRSVHAEQVRDTCEAEIIQESKSAFQKYNYNQLDNRPDMASPKQLRMIEAMWHEVSYAQNTMARKTALNGFIKRICGVDNIRFLSKKDVSKLVMTIKNMKEKGE